MERELAEKIVRAVGKMDQIPEELSTLVYQLDDDAQKRKMGSAIGALVLDAHEKITLEVVRQFPDLHPDKDGM